MTEAEFQEFLITVGYRYNKKSKTAFNTFEGFHTMICFKDKEKRYSVTLDAGVNDRTKLREMLSSYSSENKGYVLKASYSRKKLIEITVKMTVDSETDREHLKQLSHFMTELYKSGVIFPVCRVCGRNRKTGIYVIGTELTPVCDNCITRKRRIYEKRVDSFEKKTQNMPGGIFGALYGGCFGASVYVLLYQFLPSWGIFAALIAIGAYGGFVVTGNRATRKSAVICFILSVLIFAAAEYAALVAAMSVLIEREGGGIAVTEAMQATNASLGDMGYLGGILIELGIGIAAMAVIGIVYFMKRVYTRPLKISKNIL